MSEFLVRGWNTCTPDVDVGDDVLVLEDRKGEFKRVQVKTSTATVRNNGYSVQFHIPLKQLRQYISPEIHYVFMTRHQDKWVNTMIIRRKDLYEMYKSAQIGVAASDNLALYLTFKDKLSLVAIPIWADLYISYKSLRRIIIVFTHLS